MRFDGALGNVQIASDFRVVTALEQQLDNLPLPGRYSLETLFFFSFSVEILFFFFYRYRH